MKIIRSFLILSVAILGFSYVDASALPNNETRTIEQKVGKEIRKLPYYGVFDLISYQVEGDTVTLSGKVYNAINRRNAVNRVKKIEGVEKVVNNIELLPPSRFDDVIRYRTVRAFVRAGSLYRYIQGVNPSVRIIVDRGHITLEGYVRSKGDSRLANIVAKGVPGTFSVKNNLVVTRDNVKF